MWKANWKTKNRRKKKKKQIVEIDFYHTMCIDDSEVHVEL